MDEEATEVVKRIYSLSLAGYSAKKIVQNLSEEKVLTPGAYKLKNGDTRFARHVSKYGETKWEWETVQLILKDRVYMGDMENHKSVKVSYKLKKYVNVPKNQRIVVENTHEAIISREDWNKVQQLVGERHKPPHNNFENLFRGTLYCLDCGCKLNMQSPVKKRKRYHNYRCKQHYLYPEKCPKPHQITYSNIYNVVFERIQKLAKLMRDDDGLMKLIRQKSSGDTKADKLVAEKGKAEKRLTICPDCSESCLRIMQKGCWTTVIMRS